MRYIDRDIDENITGLFIQEQYKEQETLPEDDPEVQAFINRDTIDLDEVKILDEITVLNRVEAIQSLKDKGELPVDYIDKIATSGSLEV